MTNQAEFGATVIDAGTVRFCVWAPAARKVEVEIYPPPEGIVRHAMAEEGGGVWSGVADGGPGTLYRYRLDEEWGYPDPYSRSQPEGVHGPSQVVDPGAFGWTDNGWPGLDLDKLVIYECHVGVYTPQGTFDALIGQLDALRSLGVTALELMPIAEFPGSRNWGYDGASLFAPSSVYGGHENLRRLVDAAHAHGLGVILDVVYNHLGPDGNYLPTYSPDYFTSRHQTPWGDAVNFDGENSGYVRRYVSDNALMWLREYHIDGFRLDATEQIYDDSDKHILQELAEIVAENRLSGRKPLLIAEHEQHDLRIVTSRENGGYGLDGLWLDDFHHSLHVLLTGERTGYLERFQGKTEELAAILNAGALFEQEAACAISPKSFIYCLQNHDQVGNRALGERLSHLIDLERYKAAIALLLLSPATPLIFMGDEFAASSPFLFFTDHREELAPQVVAGRRAEFEGLWGAAASPAQIPDPQAEETFLRSRLHLSEREQPRGKGVLSLYKELLRLWREDAAFQKRDRDSLVAVALGPSLLGLASWSGGDRRLLIVNFGAATSIDVAEQAWLDGPSLEGRGGQQAAWRPLLSTAEERFAGPGSELPALTLQPGVAVELPEHCAVLWAAETNGVDSR